MECIKCQSTNIERVCEMNTPLIPTYGQSYRIRYLRQCNDCKIIWVE